MSKNRKWTSAEDSKLIAQVKVSPQNLKAAFNRASKELKRTTGACSNRWYTVLSKSYKDNPDAVCFAVFSKKNYGVNRKNCNNETTISANKGIWNSIINFIKKLK